MDLVLNEVVFTSLHGSTDLICNGVEVMWRCGYKADFPNGVDALTEFVFLFMTKYNTPTHVITKYGSGSLSKDFIVRTYLLYSAMEGVSCINSLSFRDVWV